jgi:hypothetical protein
VTGGRDESENILACSRIDLSPRRGDACFEAGVEVGSGSERMGGSDVGKRGCYSYLSVLSFRGP